MSHAELRREEKRTTTVHTRRYDACLACDVGSQQSASIYFVISNSPPGWLIGELLGRNVKSKFIRQFLCFLPTQESYQGTSLLFKSVCLWVNRSFQEVEYPVCLQRRICIRISACYTLGRRYYRSPKNRLPYFVVPFFCLITLDECDRT